MYRRACGHVDLGTRPHQVLASTLTLSQPRGADYDLPILMSTPSFESHRRACQSSLFGGFTVAPTQKWWLKDWRSSTHKCTFIINDFLRNPQFSCFLTNWLKVTSYLEYLMLSPKMAFWAVKFKRLMYLSFRAVSIDIFCAMVLVFFGTSYDMYF